VDGRFLDAFTLLPKQKVICGYATKPLCLRHRVVLTSLNSPFVDGREDIDPFHVIVAAKVMSSHRMEDMMSNEPTKQDIAEVDRMIEDKEYFMSQIKAVYDCIREQSHWPVFWKKTSTTGDQGVPWVLNIICGLVKGGVSLEEAWTMPESQAVWINASMSIAGGSKIDIVSDSDLEAQRRLDAFYASLEQEEESNV
jgi:hypothetical protein